MPITSAGVGTGGWYVPTATWQTWNRNWSLTTSATTTSAWSDWNDNYVRTYTITGENQALWTGWSSSSAGTTIQVHSMEARVSRAPRAPQRSEEEWAAIRAENDRLRVERDALQVAARAEAHKLLAMVLTPAQFASYEAGRFFDVVGSEGGVYRIHHGTSGNIRRLINGVEVNRLCVHPQLHVGAGHLPTEDCLAAQALALMHDEVGAVSLANVHQGQRHLAAVA